MSTESRAPTFFCPCGDRLWTKAELLAEDEDMARHIAEAYLSDDSAYCLDEDDVVPREYWRPAPAPFGDATPASPTASAPRGPSS